jgi:glycosyltransferase involved in cell wall biosynthesis
MAPALVSCIVPVYNRERYLGETLDSIFAQTYRPIEVIVVDDGSTDRTADVIASYGDRIVALRQSNAGPSAARNCGLEAARGDFIALGDSDDLWHPERLSRQMARFAERPELEMCLPHIECFWTPDLAEEKDAYADPRVGRIAPSTATSALVARRAVFDRVGGFDTSLRTAEDIDWWIRALESGAIGELLPDVLLFYRLHATNMTRLEAGQCIDDLVESVKRSIDRRRPERGGRPRSLDQTRTTGRG